MLEFNITFELKGEILFGET